MIASLMRSVPSSIRSLVVFGALVQAAIADPNLLFLTGQPGPGNISAPNRTVSLTVQTSSISSNLAASAFTVRLLDSSLDTTVTPFSISYAQGVSTLRFTVPANFVFPSNRTFGVTVREGSGPYSNSLPIAILPTGFTISPAAGRQGQIGLVVTITGTNTRFGQGLGTFIGFGPGVSVNGYPAGSAGRINDADVLSPTSARVSLNIDFTAPLATRDVSITGPDALTLAGGFTVQAPFPVVITSVIPSSGYPGITVTLGTTGLSGTFANNAFIITLTPNGGGPSVSVTSTSVSGNNIQFPVPPSLVVSSPVLYTIQLQGNNTNGLPFASTNSPTFLVTPPPTLSISPSVLRPGSTVPVVITGTYTNFVAGVTAVTFSNGITAGPVTVTSPTTLQTTLVIPFSAPLGTGSFQETTGQETASGSFTIGTPSVAIVSPAAVATGATVNVSVSGTNTSFAQGATSVSFGPGITTNSVSVSDAGTLVANITVAANATPGVRSATVTTGPQVLLSPAGLTVVAPSLVLVNPASGVQGQGLNVTVTGANTSFVQGVTTASFGAGITVNSLTVNSSNSLIANLTIAPSASIGVRDVVVTTGIQTITGAGAFTVNAPPFITSVSPNSGAQGQTETVTVTGQNTSFIQGLSTLSLGAGIAVNSVTVGSSGSLSANVSIAPNAPLGPRDLTVATGTQIVTGSALFNVTAVPVISSITPSAGAQGQTQNVTVIGQNTSFVQGISTLSLGAGVTVNSVTVGSSGSLIANITIAPNAAVGSRDVTVTTGTQVAVGTALYTVNGTPAIVGVSPSAGAPGQTQNVTITGQNTNFVQGVSIVNLGPGIAVNTVSVSSSGTLIANITVAPNATLGSRDVTVTTGTQVAVGVGLFNVSAAALLTSASPSTGKQGQSLTIVLTAVNTGFVQGTTSVSFGPGIIVTGVQVNSTSSVTATISIDPGAALGPRDVVVTTGSQLASGSGLFTVQPSASIASVSPSTVAQGRTQTLTIFGLNTNFTSSSVVNLGPGITVNYITVNGPTTIAANITITAAAAIGPRNVVVTSAAEVASGSSLLTVVSGPVISSISPSAGQQGRTLNITVTGSNTNLVQGLTTLNLGSGITVNSLTVSSAGSLTANIAVASNATLGARDVVVITGGETASGVGLFSVLAAAPASITSVSPTSGAQGRTLNVSITGADTHFADGTSAVSFGAGITINSVSVSSATALTANITIDPSATLGARDVTVSTGTETATGVGGFVVTPRPLVSISSVSPNRGNQGQTLTIALTGQGTNFVQGVTTSNFGPGITVNAVAVQNATGLLINITIAPNATLGLRDVAVATGTETATATGAFTVNAPGPGISSITPSSADRGQTLSVTIVGSNTSFSQVSSVVSFGPGVSVNSTAVTNPTLLTANITISPSATLGTRDVTVTTGSEIATSSGGFTITAPARLQSITPSAASPGSTLTATIAGQGTNFVQGSVAVDLGQGISIGTIAVLSPTVLQVQLVVAPGAAIGPRNVSVTSGGSTLTLPSGFAVVASGVPLSCSATSGVPPLLRAEGATELVGDIVLVCTGGTSGLNQSFNLQVFLNTQITSRLVLGNTTEALLIIDENLAVGSVVNGERAGPNGNSVVFTNIPFTSPGGGQRTIRITNIRANAAGLGASNTLIPTQVTAFLAVSSSQALPLNNPQLTVGYIQPGLRFDTRDCGGNDAFTSTAFEQCLGRNDAGAKSDLRNGNIGTIQFSLRYREGFQTAFRPRLAPGQTGQGMAGVTYYSESGLLYNLAGVANSGTRFAARFSNIPAGVRLFVTNTPSFGSSASISANLINGTGGTTTRLTCPLNSSPGIPSSEVAVVNGNGTAVWEVTGSDPAALETATFGVAVVYPPDLPNGLPGLGQVSITGNLDPSFASGSGADQASSSLPIPRFSGPGTNVPAFSIISCVTNILFPFVTAQVGFDTGISIANTSRTSFAGQSRQQAGVCTLNYFGNTNAGAGPVAQTTNGPVAPGASLTFVLSTGGNLGIQGTPGFQGYLIAECNFQHAHGFAFITDGPIGTARVAEGYLGLVLENGIGTRTGPGEALGH